MNKLNLLLILLISSIAFGDNFQAPVRRESITIGNSSTAATNIKLHRGATGIQFLDADDVTADGTDSSNIKALSGDLFISKTSANVALSITAVTSGDTRLILTTAGGSANSTMIQFDTTVDFTMGVDNTDLNKFKFVPGNTTIEGAPGALQITTAGDIIVPGGDVLISAGDLSVLLAGSTSVPHLILQDTTVGASGTTTLKNAEIVFKDNTGTAQFTIGMDEDDSGRLIIENLLSPSGMVMKNTGNSVFQINGGGSFEFNSAKLDGASFLMHGGPGVSQDFIFFINPLDGITELAVPSNGECNNATGGTVQAGNVCSGTWSAAHSSCSACTAGAAPTNAVFTNVGGIYNYSALIPITSSSAATFAVGISGLKLSHTKCIGTALGGQALNQANCGIRGNTGTTVNLDCNTNNAANAAGDTYALHFQCQ